MKVFWRNVVVGLAIGALLEVAVFHFLYQLPFDVQSISRIIAVLLINLLGNYLASIQKMPDYKVN